MLYIATFAKFTHLKNILNIFVYLDLSEVPSLFIILDFSSYTLNEKYI